MKQNSEQKVEDMNVSPTCGKPLVMGSTVFNEDCMTVMARYPDKYFDLAVVDPPYGIIASNGRSMKDLVLHDKYDKKKWFNEKPTEEYFKELFRVSKNQIIWGGNYFNLPTPYRCAIVWDKMDYNSDFAAGELAWASFDKPLKIFKYARHAGGDDRIHPTQKPTKLYDWIFDRYGKAGDLILDTHLGSGSSRIAAHKHNLEFVGCEIDAEYFAAQEARFKEFTSQLRLFG